MCGASSGDQDLRIVPLHPQPEPGLPCLSVCPRMPQEAGSAEFSLTLETMCGSVAALRSQARHVGLGGPPVPRTCPLPFPADPGQPVFMGGPLLLGVWLSSCPPAPFKESLCLVVTTCPAMLFLTFTIEGD